MKKLLTALLCLALLAQLTVPVWAEDCFEIEIEQEALPLDGIEIHFENDGLIIEEADIPVLEELDGLVLDNDLDVDIDLNDFDGDISLDEEFAETTEKSNAADDFDIVNGVLVEYKGSR